VVNCDKFSVKFEHVLSKIFLCLSINPLYRQNLLIFTNNYKEFLPTRPEEFCGWLSNIYTPKEERIFAEKQQKHVKMLTNSKLFFLYLYLSPQIRSTISVERTRSKNLKISLHYGTYFSEFYSFNFLVSKILNISFIFRKIFCYMRPNYCNR
jgi:hypothetical protein